jgi:hypothetical protein
VAFAKSTGIYPAECIIVDLVRKGSLVVEVVVNELFTVKFRVWVFRQLFVPFIEVEPEKLNTLTENKGEIVYSILTFKLLKCIDLRSLLPAIVIDRNILPTERREILIIIPIQHGSFSICILE